MVLRSGESISIAGFVFGIYQYSNLNKAVLLGLQNLRMTDRIYFSSTSYKQPYTSSSLINTATSNSIRTYTSTSSSIATFTFQVKHKYDNCIELNGYAYYEYYYTDILSNYGIAIGDEISSWTIST